MAKLETQSRFKSKIFWVSLATGIALIVRAFGVDFIDDATIAKVIDSSFGLITLFGVANSPTSANKF